MSPCVADRGRGLVAESFFREADTIMDLPALFFDNIMHLRVFMQIHEVFHDRVVFIEDVRGTDGVGLSVWAVLVGLGQYVQHYSGINLDTMPVFILLQATVSMAHL